MARHAFMKEFQANVTAVTAPPFAPSHQAQINQKNLEGEQADRVISGREGMEGHHGNFIHTLMARHENAGGTGLGDDNENDEDDRNKAYANKMRMLQVNAITLNALSKINIEAADITRWTSERYDELSQRHEKASRLVDVAEENILRNENGEIASAEERAMMEAEGEFCSALLVKDELMFDANGNPLSLHQLELLEENLNEMQSIEAYQNGEIDFADLPTEHQISVLAKLPEEEREEIYAESGISPEERSGLEESIASFKNEDLLEKIDGFQRPYGTPTINGGEIMSGVTGEFGRAAGLYDLTTAPAPEATPAMTPAPVQAAFHPALRAGF